MLEASRSYSQFLDNETAIQHGSGFETDNFRLPSFRVPDYASTQINVALGCIEALEMMITRENDVSVEVRISPYGQFALIRNALDAAVTCLWMLDPVSNTGRLKRRLLLEVDETYKAAAMKASQGQPVAEWKKQKRARIREVANQAGLTAWNPLKADLDTTSKMLRSIERHHVDPVMPWLAWWQLASGHAHGKSWATLASHDREEIDGSRDGDSATYRVTANFGVLAGMLLETMKLIRCALERYQMLARTNGTIRQ
ncbi:hypothetical protein AS038_15650 [Arthrobacter sp. NIO-1057]|nr:hypothetical protein AS038_15650 [Arthrobacter sp. NIO-1057]SCC51229.1 hypothetical protein GA0061084_3200 [Arthrobacter sp. NIO-1057]